MEMWEEIERIEKTLDEANDALLGIKNEPLQIKKGLQIRGEVSEEDTDEEKKDMILGIDVSGEVTSTEMSFPGLT